METHLYKVTELSYHYRLGKEILYALKNINFTINQGEFVTLSGPSGSGKSTLLNLLGLIEPIQEGNIYFGEKNLKDLSEEEKNHIRRHDIGFIFQQFHLIPILTAEENIAYFLNKTDLSKNEIKARVDETLMALQLYDHKKKRPLEMSGGQRQRVAIARALAKHPKVIIADEPTASLDQKTGREIIAALKKLTQEKGVTVIVATHDPMVISFSDCEYHLVDGILQEAKLCLS